MSTILVPPVVVVGRYKANILVPPVILLWRNIRLIFKSHTSCSGKTSVECFGPPCNCGGEI